MYDQKLFNENGLIPEDVIERCEEYKDKGVNEFESWKRQLMARHTNPNDYVFEDDEVPNPTTGENIPSILHHSNKLMALYYELVRYIPRLSQEYTTDFSHEGNSQAKGYTIGGSGIDESYAIGILALDISPESVKTMISQRFGTFQSLLEVAGLPQISIAQAKANTEYISALVLLHEYGHAIHRECRTHDLIEEEFNRLQANSHSDSFTQVYLDHRDGNDDINRERMEQLQISPLPGDIVQTQRWIAEASQEEKIRKYNELNGLGEYYGPNPTDSQLAEFCKRLYLQTEYIYTHLTSEVFANLFVGHCAKELPTLQELARNTGQSDTGIRSIAY